MADVPNQILTQRDPGFPVSTGIIDQFMFWGTSSKGDVNAVRQYNSVSSVVDVLGDGPLAEDLCSQIALAGGPVFGVKLDHTSTPGVITMGTPVVDAGSDGTFLVVASATDPAGPYDRYEQASGEITVSGLLGVAEFRYTLDGENYSKSLPVPAGGTFVIPNTGLDITMTTPTTGFVVGDLFPFSTSANHFDITALAAARDAVLATNDEFAALFISGREDDTSDGATSFAAIDSYMTTFALQKKFAGCVMDAGVPELSGSDYDYATVKSNWSGSISNDTRTAACFAGTTRISQKPFVGWGQIHGSLVSNVAVKAANVLLSTHLGLVEGGELEGVLSIDYDEDKNGQGMSAANFITTRTWIGKGDSAFINRGNMRHADGSNIGIWPRRRIMDVMLDTAHKALQKYQNSKLRVLTDGTGRIDPVSAGVIEAWVNGKLSDALLVPRDHTGRAGHVADVRYIIDQNVNIQSTNQLIGSVSSVADSYNEDIRTSLGFASEI